MRDCAPLIGRCERGYMLGANLDLPRARRTIWQILTCGYKSAKLALIIDGRKLSAEAEKAPFGLLSITVDVAKVSASDGQEELDRDRA